MFDITEPLIPGAVAPTGDLVSSQRQLTEHLQQAILTGLLPAGSQLMSSRSLARELGVSRNTVVNAYEHLAVEGYMMCHSCPFVCCAWRALRCVANLIQTKFLAVSQ